MSNRTTEAQHVARWRQRVSRTIRYARTDAQFIAARRSYVDIDMSRLTMLGWQALNSGATQDAQQFFRAALNHDPYTTSAWIGLSRAVEDYANRRTYLQAAIDLHQLLDSVTRSEYADRAHKPAVELMRGW